MDNKVTDPAFELTIIGSFDIISTSAAVKIVPDVYIKSARSKLDEFDILVVPGGPPPIVFSLVESNSEVLQIVKDFGQLQHGETENPRTILSICTRALFLGASGLLDGLRATTHHIFLDELQESVGKRGRLRLCRPDMWMAGLERMGLCDYGRWSFF
jgi:transcriptional regulator GlxA family with amidase domain